MDEKTGSVMRYIFGALGLIGILAWAWWGLANAPFFAEGLKRTTLQVQGVSCGSCLSAIREELSKKPGMVALAADLEQGLVRIDHRPPLHEEAIVRVLADLGYPARPVGGQVAPPSGEPAAKGCSGCEQKACPATAASWRELFRKYSAVVIPEKKRQGEGQ